jgi:hypothetical protein
VSDDGTDVFVEFHHTSTSTVTITLEGLSLASKKDITSLKALGKVIGLEFV